jgi:signal transduction histidine kinase
MASWQSATEDKAKLADAGLNGSATLGARAPWTQRLNTRLWLLTILFVLLAEVLIFVPSVANFRLNWLESRLNTAATVSALLFDEKIAPSQPLVKADILMALGVRAIVIRAEGRSDIQIQNEMPERIDATTDIKTISAFQSIMEAYHTFRTGGERVIMVTGQIGQNLRRVDILVDESTLYDQMLIYSRNVAILSLLISIITAGLVFLALGRLVLNPVLRMTESMSEFASASDKRRAIIQMSDRRDEIGGAERNLAQMQTALVNALDERKHLADLGLAVSKINHDMRNLLTSAQLMSDRLSEAKDPTVARLAPKLVGALDRAVRYSDNVLAYGKAKEAAPERQAIKLSALIDDVFALVRADYHADKAIRFQNMVDKSISISCDPDQVFRAFFNLVRNASQALAADTDQKQVAVISVTMLEKQGRAHFQIVDNGPGLPARARNNIFKPFEGSARSGGTGLGLAIAREIAEGHGGSLELIETAPGRTVFEITFSA